MYTSSSTIEKKNNMNKNDSEDANVTTCIDRMTMSDSNNNNNNILNENLMSIGNVEAGRNITNQSLGAKNALRCDESQGTLENANDVVLKKTVKKTPKHCHTAGGSNNHKNVCFVDDSTGGHFDLDHQTENAENDNGDTSCLDSTGLDIYSDKNNNDNIEFKNNGDVESDKCLDEERTQQTSEERKSDEKDSQPMTVKYPGYLSWYERNKAIIHENDLTGLTPHQAARMRIQIQAEEKKREADDRALRSMHRNAVAESHRGFGENVKNQVSTMWLAITCVVMAAQTFRAKVQEHKSLNLLRRKFLPLLALKSRGKNRRIRLAEIRETMTKPSLEVLKADKILSLLTDGQLLRLIDEMEPKLYFESDIVMYQGTDGNECFVIHSGTATVYIEKKLIMNSRSSKERVDSNTNAKGQNPFLMTKDFVIGTCDFVSGEPRMITLRANSELSVWVIRKSSFDRCIEEDPKVRAAVSTIADVQVSNVPIHSKKVSRPAGLSRFLIFSVVKRDILVLIAETLKSTAYSAGSTIISEGMRATTGVYVLHGQVSLRITVPVQTNREVALYNCIRLCSDIYQTRKLSNLPFYEQVLEQLSDKNYRSGKQFDVIIMIEAQVMLGINNLIFGNQYEYSLVAETHIDAMIIQRDEFINALLKDSSSYLAVRNEANLTRTHHFAFWYLNHHNTQQFPRSDVIKLYSRNCSGILMDARRVSLKCNELMRSSHNNVKDICDFRHTSNVSSNGEFNVNGSDRLRITAHNNPDDGFIILEGRMQQDKHYDNQTEEGHEPHQYTHPFFWPSLQTLYFGGYEGSAMIGTQFVKCVKINRKDLHAALAYLSNLDPFVSAKHHYEESTIKFVSHLTTPLRPINSSNRFHRSYGEVTSSVRRASPTGEGGVSKKGLLESKPQQIGSSDVNSHFIRVPLSHDKNFAIPCRADTQQQDNIASDFFFNEMISLIEVNFVSANNVAAIPNIAPLHVPKKKEDTSKSVPNTFIKFTSSPLNNLLPKQSLSKVPGTLISISKVNSAGTCNNTNAEDNCVGSNSNKVSSPCKSITQEMHLQLNSETKSFCGESRNEEVSRRESATCIVITDTSNNNNTNNNNDTTPSCQVDKEDQAAQEGGTDAREKIVFIENNTVNDERRRSTITSDGKATSYHSGNNSVNTSWISKRNSLLEGKNCGISQVSQRLPSPSRRSFRRVEQTIDPTLVLSLESAQSKINAYTKPNISPNKEAINTTAIGNTQEHNHKSSSPTTPTTDPAAKWTPRRSGFQGHKTDTSPVNRVIQYSELLEIMKDHMSPNSPYSMENMARAQSAAIAKGIRPVYDTRNTPKTKLGSINRNFKRLHSKEGGVELSNTNSNVHLIDGPHSERQIKDNNNNNSNILSSNFPNACSPPKRRLMMLPSDISAYNGGMPNTCLSNFPPVDPSSPSTSPINNRSNMISVPRSYNSNNNNNNNNNNTNEVIKMLFKSYNSIESLSKYNTTAVDTAVNDHMYKDNDTHLGDNKKDEERKNSTPNDKIIKGKYRKKTRSPNSKGDESSVSPSKEANDRDGYPMKDSQLFTPFVVTTDSKKIGNISLLRFDELSKEGNLSSFVHDHDDSIDSERDEYTEDDDRHHNERKKNKEGKKGKIKTMSERKRISVSDNKESNAIKDDWTNPMGKLLKNQLQHTRLPDCHQPTYSPRPPSTSSNCSQVLSRFTDIEDHSPRQSTKVNDVYGIYMSPSHGSRSNENNTLSPTLRQSESTNSRHITNNSSNINYCKDVLNFVELPAFRDALEKLALQSIEIPKAYHMEHTLTSPHSVHLSNSIQSPVTNPCRQTTNTNNNNNNTAQTTRPNVSLTSTNISTISSPFNGRQVASSKVTMGTPNRVLPPPFGVPLTLSHGSNGYGSYHSPRNHRPPLKINTETSICVSLNGKASHF